MVDKLEYYIYNVLYFVNEKILIMPMLIFIIIIMLSVAIHEMGHALTAWVFKEQVDIISVGFGRRLFGFQLGNTDCRFSAIPFGGYVKIPIIENDSGELKLFLKKIAILSFGPLFNILFAMIVLLATYIYFNIDRTKTTYITKHNHEVTVFYKLTRKTVNKTISTTKAITDKLFELKNPAMAVKNVKGPIEMVHALGSLLRQDSVYLFGFFVLMNLNIGIINLLPLPGLDGGNIAESIICYAVNPYVASVILKISRITGSLIMWFVLTIIIYKQLWILCS